MLVTRLTKLSSVSGALRGVVLKKEAGLLAAAGKGVVNAFKAAPIRTSLAAVGAVGGVAGGVGKFRQYKAGFDPATRNLMPGS